MNKFIFNFLLICLLGFSANAQNISTSISGVALEENGDPLLYANILLLSAQDSTLVKAELTDEAGKYTFVNVPAAKYFIKISYVGAAEYTSEHFNLGPKETKIMKIINLRQGEDLEEVLVTAERRIIEVRPDKIIFNVENSISAGGSNALELLRKSPGVVLDNNENVTLMGKSGARIYINNRPSRLSGTDLAEYLRSLNASDIDNIEIITSPSAKYEAEGNAGIININLKKNENYGTNGSVTANYGNGVVEDWSGQVQLNHRKDFYNIFGNYGYTDRNSFSFENLDREQVGGFYNKATERFRNRESHNLRLGADFFINKNHTIGFIVTGDIGETESPGASTTEIGDLQSRDFIDSLLISETFQDGSNNRLDANINYQIKGENDLFWNFDFNYGGYNTEAENSYFDFFSTPESIEQRNRTNNADDQETSIDILTGKVDFEKNIGKGKFAAGVKTSIVDTDNSFRFFNTLNGQPVLNELRSSDFTYKENVNAAYVNYDWKVNKWSYNLGLRTEASLTEGVLSATLRDSVVSRDYIDLFPSAGVSLQLDPKNTLAFAFSRRLDRPNYQNLNPFVNFINRITTRSGNPFLRPQYTTNLQLSYTHNYAISAVLKYSRTEDLISLFSEAMEVEGDIPGQPTGERFFRENLGSQENFSLNLSAPFTITEWWSTFSNLTTYVVSNQGDYGNGNVVDIVRPAINVYTQHTFSLPMGFSLEASGFFYAGGVWGGNFETGPFGSVGVGLQKKIFNDAGNLKVNFTDIFLTSVWSADVNFGQLFITGSGGWDSRRLKLSYTHSFGNQNVKTRKRKTGAEDEGKRSRSN